MSKAKGRQSSETYRGVRCLFAPVGNILLKSQDILSKTMLDTYNVCITPTSMPLTNLPARKLAFFGIASVLVGCSASSDAPGSDPYYDELGAKPFQGEGPMGKADGAGVPGPSVALDNGATAVWKVKNAWEDRNTAAAREAGMAWSADSGLNWDEKYVRWVASLKKIDGVSFGKTFELTTPWGKTLPSPKLECAEVAMFMRLAFAAWYKLPFYMTTIDENGTRIFFGHMGAVTANGRYKNLPNYGSRYRDYSGMSKEEYQANWPQDAKLRAAGMWAPEGRTAGDNMDYIFEGARAGGYFDEIFLNKRVGHLALHLLSFFGSVNLANSRNTYNLKPEALQQGDVLVKRYKKKGIGHVLLVKHVEDIEGGRMEAQLASGSMPRRQPKWESGVSSKSAFTAQATGGDGETSDGTPYYKLGGGLKRWRVAKNWNGRWTNTWMNADESSWINDQDYDRIKARPEQFKSLLGEVPPEQLRDALLEMINDQRAHLSKYPASCSARTRREDAFKELYALAPKLSMTKEQIDSNYRKLEDYVFGELEYEQSKTCCWNSSTNKMYEIIMDYAKNEQQAACVVPTVFMNDNGYQKYKDHAVAMGQGDAWKPWTEDELCEQSGVASDTPKALEHTPWCSLGTGGTGGTGGGTGGTGGGTGGTGGGTGGTGGGTGGTGGGTGGTGGGTGGTGGGS